jgi:hypothetical protein
MWMHRQMHTFLHMYACTHKYFSRNVGNLQDSCRNFIVKGIQPKCVTLTLHLKEKYLNFYPFLIKENNHLTTLKQWTWKCQYINVQNRNLCTRGTKSCGCVHTGNPVEPDTRSWSNVIRSRRVNFWMYSSVTSVKVSKTYWHVAEEIKINSELVDLSTFFIMSFYEKQTFQILDLVSYSPELGWNEGKS